MQNLAKGALLIGLWSFATPSVAWRETGHFVVCEIAYQNLSHKAKRAVEEIVGAEGSFARQCTWPDMVRKSDEWSHTYPWHFINLDDGQEYWDSGTLNPRGDIVRALMKAERVLRDPTADPVDRKHFLRFAGHFAGDIHQPLHAGKKIDLGGNRVEIPWLGEAMYSRTDILRSAVPGSACTGEAYIDKPTGECVFRKISDKKVNLHIVWDLFAVRHFAKGESLTPQNAPYVPENVYRRYASHLMRTADESQVRKWRKGTYWDWAKESFYWRNKIYPEENAIGLGEAYFEKHIATLNDRMTMAGYRLAEMLNRALDPDGYGSARLNFFQRSLEEVKARYLSFGQGDL